MNLRSIVTLLIIVSFTVSLAACSKKKTKTAEKSAGNVQFTVSETDVNEADGSVVMTVSRSGGASGEASVSYQASDDTADGDDYTLAPGQLSWSDGDTGNKTITVVINNDSEMEYPESFQLSLQSANGAELGTIQSVVIQVNDDDSIVINGTVKAPNGTIGTDDASPTVDHIADAVDGGVNVEIFALDNYGELTGNAISTTSTDTDGSFAALVPPDGLSKNYVAVAGGVLQSHIITDQALIISPISDAARTLVLDAVYNRETSFDRISLDEVKVVQEETANLTAQLDLGGINGSALSVTEKFLDAAGSNVDMTNITESIVDLGEICGRVYKTVGGTEVPLENIKIRVRDFGDWVTRAKASTAADGGYCVNVSAGRDYIIGAINRTGDGHDADHTASEWWTAGGGAPTPFDADKITVNASTITVGEGTELSGVDFELASGARIKGTVTTADGGSPEGIKVLVREFDSYMPLASAYVKADGSYRVNVAAGEQAKYTLIARNTTLVRPYATQLYTNDTFGTHLIGLATPVVKPRVDNDAVTVPGYDFDLAIGSRVEGRVVTDSDSNSPVPGMRVRLDTQGDGPAARTRTDLLGHYRIWMADDSYRVRSRGQTSGLFDLQSTEGPEYTVHAEDFNQIVTEYYGQVVTDSGVPVSQAKIFLRDTSGFSLVSQEVSNSDGTFTVYEPRLDTSFIIQVRVDGHRSYGNIVYNEQIDMASGDFVSSDVEMTIYLPESGSGFVDTGISDMYSIKGINALPNIPIRVSSPWEFFTTRSRGDGTFTLNLPTGVGIFYDVNFAGTCDITNIQAELLVGAVLDANDCVQIK